MHTLQAVAEKTDEIAPVILYLAVGYLEGAVTLEEAAATAHTHPADFLRQLQLARDVCRMSVENEREVAAICEKRPAGTTNVE